MLQPSNSTTEHIPAGYELHLTRFFLNWIHFRGIAATRKDWWRQWMRNDQIMRYFRIVPLILPPNWKANFLFASYASSSVTCLRWTKDYKLPQVLKISFVCFTAVYVNLNFIVKPFCLTPPHQKIGMGCPNLLRD